MNTTPQITDRQREATARLHERLAALKAKHNPKAARLDNHRHVEAARRLRESAVE